MIKNIQVDGCGYIYATPEDKIELVFKTGECAPVAWYRHKNKEYHSRYVISIEFDNNECNPDWKR